MTKTIVIGAPEAEKKQLKPIQFIRYLKEDSEKIVDSGNLPKDWKYIELIAKQYTDENEFDLMYAYDDPNKRDNGVLYLGYWNDGVVES